MIKYEQYTIDDSKSRNRTQFKTKCPNCAAIGKKHLGDDLSVNMNLKVFHCHKCEFKGSFGERVEKEIYKDYKLPDSKNLTELSLKHLQEFSRRGINQSTVIRNKIKSALNDYYAFVYYEGETVVNMKYRKFGEKKFMQAAEAKPTMYKYNDIVNSEKIIVCEGEFDALAWEEAGYLFSTSVNQGAPNEKDLNVENKIQCIYNCFDVFESAEIIYLSVDTDPNGQRLQKELIKIFTPEKIRLIDHLDCKDANEILLKYGKEKLVECFENAKEIPVDGVYECMDFEAQILNDYRNGQPVGTTTHFDVMDQLWKHRMGEVNIWTGYNNEGKSLLLKQLLLLKSKYDGWKHAIFSPEEMPFNEWYTDVIESYIGKSADKSKAYWNNYMTEMQMSEGIKFMQEHFYMVYPDEEQSLDEILKRFSYLVRKKNIKTVTLDPYNQIQHKMLSGEREDLYISRFMTKLKRFAVQHDVAVHLVAHQTTPAFKPNDKYPEPNIYTIKGGGTFADKADNVLIVWREHRNTDPKNTLVKFISKKIKKQKLTGIPGACELFYDRNKNRYLYGEASPLDKTLETEQQLITIKPNIHFYEPQTTDPFDGNSTNDEKLNLNNCPF